MEVMPGGHESLQVQQQGVDSGGRGLPELPLWAVGSVNSLCVTHILRCEERAPRHRSVAGGGSKGCLCLETSRRDAGPCSALPCPGAVCTRHVGCAHADGHRKAPRRRTASIQTGQRAPFH